MSQVDDADSSAPPLPPSVLAVLTELTRQYEVAIAEIDQLGETDGRTAFRAATILGRLLREWADAQAPRRGRHALAAREQTKTTLRTLAADNDLESKSRVQQLVDGYRATMERTG